MNVCGVVTAMPQGHSWAPHSTIDLLRTWEPSGPALARAASAGSGQAHRRLTGSGRGGDPVVVRGRESRPHGEGGQCVSS